MKAEIKKLELTNYRNIKNAVYEFNGDSLIIGDNRIGKTNTLEAIHYLLTDKLLGGSSDIQQIKPLDDTKATVVVSATLKVDEKEITLTKEYGEKWVVNQSNEMIMKGHFTNYYFNGFKCPTLKDYNLYLEQELGIKGLAGIKVDTTRLAIDPFYIGELCNTGDWKEVRKLIINAIGDVSNEEVFNVKPATKELKEDLEKSSGNIDILKSNFNSEIASLKEQIAKDDGQLELNIGVEKLSDEQITELENRKLALLCGESIKQKLALIKYKGEFINARLAEKKEYLEQSIKMRANLLNDYEEEQKREIVVETKCPTCNQLLPDEQIEKAKEKLEADKKDYLEKLVCADKELIKKCETTKAEIEKLTTERQALIDEYNELKKRLADTENTDELAKITETLSNQQALNALIKQKEGIRATKEQHRDKLIKLETKKALIGLFIETKLNLLNEKLSKVFDDVSFKLFETNIAGNTEFCCKPYILGTNTIWNAGSKSERVITGIAIAEKIINHYHLTKLPFLFDEGGEISTATFKERIKTDSQIICVKVVDGINTPKVAPLSR